MPLQVARETRSPGARGGSGTSEYARGVLPKRKPTAKATAGREDPGSGFFQRCLAKGRGSTPEERRNWRDGIFEQIREVMLLQGSLSIQRLCQLVPVSRRSFYRSLQEQPPAEEETEVRIGHPTDCPGASPALRVSTNHRGAPPPRNAGEPQTRGADHAQR